MTARQRFDPVLIDPDHAALAMRDSPYPQIAAFLTSCRRNQWLCENAVNFYLRRNQRWLGETGCDACLDIANVHTPYPGQGRFSAIMDYLETLRLVLYIENVHNQRLAAWFARRPGYQRDNAAIEICFFRRPG